MFSKEIVYLMAPKILFVIIVSELCDVFRRSDPESVTHPSGVSVVSDKSTAMQHRSRHRLALV